MKIFIEFELDKFFSNPGGISDLDDAIDEAKRIIVSDLREGGIYSEGTKDHIVPIGEGKGRDLSPLGRVVLTANLNSGLYEFREIN